MDPETVLAPPPVALDEALQHLHGRLAEMRLLGNQPLLEGRAVLDEEARQELSAVELGRRREVVGIDRLPLGAPRQGLRERLDIEPAVRLRAETDLQVAAGDQAGHAGFGQRRAEVVDRLAQGVPGGLRPALRPQQAHQVVAAERPVPVTGQVGQQGPDLLRLEAADLAVARPDLEPA